MPARLRGRERVGPAGTAPATAPPPDVGQEQNATAEEATEAAAVEQEGRPDEGAGRGTPRRAGGPHR